MAKGGGKNAILLIVAVAAIGGAFFFFQSMMPEENSQYDQWVYYVDPETLNDEQQVTYKIRADQIAEYATKQLADDPAVDERLVNAGICGHCGKYVPLVGHGSLPETCPICNESLAGYSKSGEKLP
ncbi:MAG: hypothetical protein ACIARQ_09810 [Phycisphaerales bacterium JB061]